MVLAVVLVLGVFSVPAAANDGNIAQPYASSYFNNTSVTATKSGSTMTIKVNAYTADVMSTLYASSISVQKWNGSYWESVRTFDVKYGTNGRRIDGTYTYTPSSSGTYRAYAYFYAANGSGSSSESKNSVSLYF